MKFHAILSVVPGCTLIATFVLNVYIALYDSTLFQDDIAHYEVNIVIAFITLVAGVLLCVKRRSMRWKIAAGVLWPVVYLASLAFDVSTDLCFPNGIQCWPSVADSYKYLILNESFEGWVLSPYTMRVIIALLVITIILSVVSVALSYSEKRNARKSSRGSLVQTHIFRPTLESIRFRVLGVVNRR